MAFAEQVIRYILKGRHWRHKKWSLLGKLVNPILAGKPFPHLQEVVLTTFVLAVNSGPAICFNQGGGCFV